MKTQTAHCRTSILKSGASPFFGFYFPGRKSDALVIGQKCPKTNGRSNFESLHRDPLLQFFKPVEDDVDFARCFGYWRLLGSYHRFYH